ncbi:MAG: hypothetical protein JO127_15110 [Caulobacteraceae bacterium]|nr:hypothetical protein [Caulobacteraceae bacterium]
MVILRILALAGALAACGSALAEPSVNEYRGQTAGAKNAGEVWLDGAANGYAWANAQLASQGRAKLYCQPSQTTISHDEAMRIYSEYVERHPEMGDKPMGAVMLFALEDKFPCV